MSYSPNFTGDSANISVNAIEDIVTNSSGSSIARALPIRIDTSGDIQLIDVSIEAEALAIAGVTKNVISNGGNGEIISNGKVENITTTANNGDVLYVSKTGGMTNIKPGIGVGGFVGGDFIIRMGVLYKNNVTPLQQDLLLSIIVVGQL